MIAGLEMNAGASAPVDLLAAKIIERSGMRTIVLDGTDPDRIARAVRYGDHDGTDVIPDASAKNRPTGRATKTTNERGRARHRGPRGAGRIQPVYAPTRRRRRTTRLLADTVADQIEARDPDEPIVVKGGISPSGVPHLATSTRSCAATLSPKCFASAATRSARSLPPTTATRCADCPALSVISRAISSIWRCRCGRARAQPRLAVHRHSGSLRLL